MTAVRPLLAAALLLGAAGASPAQTRSSMPTGPARPLTPEALALLPPGLRDTVARVTQQPTLTARAGAEEFVAKPELYRWLLDHPAQVSRAWRRLGVPCSEISDAGDGASAYRDANGSQLTWKPVWQGPQGRIWYAEGQAKPGPLMPAVPVKAVAVLQHAAGESDESGRVLIRHQVDVFLQTDSKAAGLVARLLGPAAPRMAESGAGQLLLFFSLMARHL